MSIKRNLKAIYDRFPPSPPAHHPVYLADSGDIYLVIVKDNQYYPFTIPDSSWSLKPAEFVEMIEDAALDAGILDILDSKIL